MSFQFQNPPPRRYNHVCMRMTIANHFEKTTGLFVIWCLGFVFFTPVLIAKPYEYRGFSI